MKIKNFINLKINGKSIDFHNLILDEYLKRFVTAQLDASNYNVQSSKKKLKYLLLKFDEPLNYDATSQLSNDSFDVCVYDGLTDFTQSISEKEVVIKYTYDLKRSLVYEYSSGWDIEISEYIGRKITAIGFTTYYNEGEPSNVCCVLDTSNYNLVLKSNEDFILTRIDTIMSDALFWSSSNKLKGPCHLTVDGGPSLLYQNTFNELVKKGHTYAQLYSVGVSSYLDSIAKEFVIGSGATITNNGTSILIKGLTDFLSNYWYQPGLIYSNSSLYPLKANYKYLIFKYKVYQPIFSINQGEIVETLKDTGAYYIQAISLGKRGKSNLTIKYERSN